MRVTVIPDRLTSPRDYGALTLRTDDVYVPAVLVPVSVSAFRELNFYPPRAFLSEGRQTRIAVTDANRRPVEIVVSTSGDLPFPVISDGPGSLPIGPAGVC